MFQYFLLFTVFGYGVNWIEINFLYIDCPGDIGTIWVKGIGFGRCFQHSAGFQIHTGKTFPLMQSESFTDFFVNMPLQIPKIVLRRGHQLIVLTFFLCKALHQVIMTQH